MGAENWDREHVETLLEVDGIDENDMEEIVEEYSYPGELYHDLHYESLVNDVIELDLPVDEGQLFREMSRAGVTYIYRKARAGTPGASRHLRILRSRNGSDTVQTVGKRGRKRVVPFLQVCGRSFGGLGVGAGLRRGLGPAPVGTVRSQSGSSVAALRRWTGVGDSARTGLQPAGTGVSRH